MVEYQKQVLDNGLRVIVHTDKTTPMVAIDVLYDVGSRDEHPERTGFAHLFEHLMFGGSAHVPDFDEPIQKAGGENNAFTNADVTNFYDVLPAENIETALWLESDRMMALDFSQRSLDVQKRVVIEEFKETCLNPPYADMWHHLSALAFDKHPYRWPTIGLDPSHIESAQLAEVESFFHSHYGPNNAILVLAGNIDAEVGFELAEKWFGNIPPVAVPNRILAQEPPQLLYKSKVIEAAVPHAAIYRGYHMVERLHPDYYAYDLLTDVLANGRSSRFYISLYKEQELFSTIDAYISGTVDPGLVVIEGKPLPGISIDYAREAIIKELYKVIDEPIPEHELEKIRNKSISSLIYSEVSCLNKAISLAYFELLGDIDLINTEVDAYQAVTPADLQRVAREAFDENNCSEIVYQPV